MDARVSPRIRASNRTPADLIGLIRAWSDARDRIFPVRSLFLPVIRMWNGRAFSCRRHGLGFASMERNDCRGRPRGFGDPRISWTPLRFSVGGVGEEAVLSSTRPSGVAVAEFGRAGDASLSAFAAACSARKARDIFAGRHPHPRSARPGPFQKVQMASPATQLATIEFHCFLHGLLCWQCFSVARTVVEHLASPPLLSSFRRSAAEVCAAGRGRYGRRVGAVHVSAKAAVLRARARASTIRDRTRQHGDFLECDDRARAPLVLGESGRASHPRRPDRRERLIAVVAGCEGCRLLRLPTASSRRADRSMLTKVLQPKRSQNDQGLSRDHPGRRSDGCLRRKIFHPQLVDTSMRSVVEKVEQSLWSNCRSERGATARRSSVFMCRGVY